MPRVGRRAVLAGALVTVLAAGCDTGDDLAPPSASSAPTGAGTEPPTTSSTPERTPDEALVDDVLDRLARTLEVAMAASSVPQLRASVQPLVQAHERHIRVLEGELPSGAPAGRPADAAGAVRVLRGAEERLHTSLVDAATRAESGALARLLASISASVTQHLTLLPADARA